MSIPSCGLGDGATRLSHDILKGVAQIADFIGESERRTNYLLERGYIPAGKIGNYWVASRRALAAFYEQLTSIAS